MRLLRAGGPARPARPSAADGRIRPAGRGGPPAGFPRQSPLMLAQRTLKSLTRAVGVGLHGGQRVEMTLRPAPTDSGIVFRRVDLVQPLDIQVNALWITDTRLATTLSAGGDPGAPKVKTIEHLLSACSGLGLDNLLIEINGEEVPILDGSAASFVFLLQSAGIELQDAPKRFMRITRPVEVRDGEGASLKWARLEPFEGYRLSFEIDFNHPAIDQTGQRLTFDMGSGRYKQEIARARTLGFTKDVDMMRSRGLALGGSMDNALVIDDYKVLNDGGLRYGDEIVKHKMLDAIGDMLVIGHPLIAAYSAFRSGHDLNNKLLRAVLADPTCFEMVSFDDAANAPPGLAELAPAW
jgi:UDP-3-O-[3-hydroxymyristoyl] N-acetylglucosamine deacetylase